MRLYTLIDRLQASRYRLQKMSHCLIASVWKERVPKGTDSRNDLNLNEWHVVSGVYRKGPPIWAKAHSEILGENIIGLSSTVFNFYTSQTILN